MSDKKQESQAGRATGKPRHPTPVTFGSFLVSLGSAALVHLGQLPEPGTDRRSVDLELARETIDLLEILQQKTQGNLDDEEQRLLDSLLYDLRLKYLEVSKEQQA